MVRRSSTAPLLLALFAFGCSGPTSSEQHTSSPIVACDSVDAGTCPSVAPSFQNDVLPVLNTECNATCHAPGARQWELADWNDVSDWQSLIKLDLEDCAMPPVDAGTYPNADRQLILDWIACGSPNN